MFKNLILLFAVVALAALTTSCGNKKELVLPEGKERRTVF